MAGSEGGGENDDVTDMSPPGAGHRKSRPPPGSGAALTCGDWIRVKGHHSGLGPAWTHSGK